MNTEQPRTDASSREHSPDHQYTLSLEQVADMYAQAGLPRTIRAIQKYCAVGKLDCRKIETETGEKWLVASYSVERHISYIREVRTDATSRDRTRPDANVRTMENKGAIGTNSHEQPRTVEAVRGPEDRYVTRLEDENIFLRTQIGVKDSQIELKDKTINALLERDRETNVLVSQLQRMLGPLLPSSKQNETAEHPTSAAETAD